MHFWIGRRRDHWDGLRVQVRHVEVLQAHGQADQSGGVGHAFGDIEGFQCGFRQLVQLCRIREQVLAQGFAHQLFDQILGVLLRQFGVDRNG